MSEDSDLEKTEPASGRKIEKAREQGQVPKSQELMSFVSMIVASSALIMMSTTFLEYFTKLIKNAFTFDRRLITNPHDTLEVFYHMAWDTLLVLLPFLVVVMIAVIGSSMSMTGMLFSLESLAPKFEKLNPIAGLGRMFSKNSLVQLVLSILKAILIGTLAYLIVKNRQDELLGLISEPFAESFNHVWQLVIWTFIWLAGSMLLLVLIDVPYQLYTYNEQMKMTKQEAKDEAKESDGNPEIKSRIRSLQRQAARKRMMANVPQADVIVTNPTHYAVALKYDNKEMAAPVVLAKGTLKLAERIIELGKENKVPVLQFPPLARALYKHVEVEQEIPPDLYAAVAEVLAYIYQLRRYETLGGDRPELPKNLDVPEALDPGEITTEQLTRLHPEDRR